MIYKHYIHQFKLRCQTQVIMVMMDIERDIALFILFKLICMLMFEFYEPLKCSKLNSVKIAIK